jgi:asparagine synthase (glutamine-hydrolysing)
MVIVGWTHPARDIRREGPALTAMAHACGDTPGVTGVVRLARLAGFTFGAHAGYADTQAPECSDPGPSFDSGPDVMVAVEGRLTSRDQLRSQLGGRSRPTARDADLLLHAYRKWGSGFVGRIDGTYAIAIWDGQRRQLLLVSDRIGAKGWHYRSDGNGGLLFATTVRGLLAHPGVTAAVDADGLNELLTLGPVRTPGHGVLCGVYDLPAGHLLHAAPGRVSTYQYWRWHPERHSHDVDTTTEFVRRILTETTLTLREQPSGAVLLSGGIASAAAAALATPANTIARRPTAYTLALAGPWSEPGSAGVDVTAARRTAAHLRLRPTMVTPTSAQVVDVGAATRGILDFPGAPSTDAPQFALLRRVAADTSTVVTGDGAAAVFGDHPWLHHPHVLAPYTFPWHRQGLTPVGLLSADARLQLLPDAYAKQRYADAVATVPYASADDATGRAHRRAAYLTLTHYLPAQLRRLDQLATAAGITAHTPFADRLLAAYMFTVPYPMRHLTNVRLGLLRHTIADLLPASVTWLPSWPPPDAHLLPAWRRSQREQLRALLADPSQPLQPLLDQARITDLLDQAAEQRPPGWHTSTAYLLDVNAWLTQHHITVA